MSLPIKLISTDFDGTLHTDLEDPPVPHGLQDLIAGLQSRGVTWVINTGRELPSLMESIELAQLTIFPDYVVAVEREIYTRENSDWVPLADWNQGCDQAHNKLFAAVKPWISELAEWIRARFEANIYEDAYSPFCLVAQNAHEADLIHESMDRFCERFPELMVVRNDIYARFSHRDYHKGSALAEIARRLGMGPENILAAGDHLNDLPMLSRRYARWLVAPDNAVPVVKERVRQEEGYISAEPYGFGVWRGLEYFCGPSNPLFNRFSDGNKEA
jgi:HAD superfamily hydrolase (TIGR01484 family)